ncbi:hypothetical protein GMDG_03793 [Pseudogymnoascus destructans 20631-21]|uniref:Uncharacterized protein n=1 Tax=Pseudogymnoascus destructans (strain ATCC MYA-4855 / 20631-21) TaxID=658429 RepID=L8G8N5_PSED2|nr:hypothetical protein GMDG_03793 [Pseudogymnoascus destructans 20631-21]
MNTIAINLQDINGDCSLPCTRSPSRPQSKTPNTLFLRCEKQYVARETYSPSRTPTSIRNTASSPNTTPAIKHYNTRLICTVEVNESCPCVIKQFSETTPHLLRTAPLPSNLKLWLLSYRTPVWCPSLE